MLRIVGNLWKYETDEYKNETYETDGIRIRIRIHYDKDRWGSFHYLIYMYERDLSMLI